MRVLVCGSRGWRNYQGVKNIMDAFPRETVWLHGGATGADSQVARWCRENNATSEVYLPCYDDKTVSVKRAPLVRNEFMLETGPDLVLAFWDGESRGTGFVLEQAKARGICTEVWLS